VSYEEDAAGVERLQAALAEVGLPGWPVTVQGDHALIWDAGPVGLAVGWAAFEVAGFEPACWSCWTADDLQMAADCCAGRCAHPGLARWPPRELLQRDRTVYCNRKAWP
jgi:hypothetical protein